MCLKQTSKLYLYLSMSLHDKIPIHPYINPVSIKCSTLFWNHKPYLEDRLIHKFASLTLVGSTVRKSVRFRKKRAVSICFHQRLDSFQNCARVAQMCARVAENCARVAVVISVRFDFLARNLVPNQKPCDPQINVRSSKKARDTNLCTNWSSRYIPLCSPSNPGHFGPRVCSLKPSSMTMGFVASCFGNLRV